MCALLLLARSAWERSVVKLAQPLFVACVMGLLAACAPSHRAEVAPPPPPLPMAPPPLAAPAPLPAPEIAPPVRERTVVRKHRRVVRETRHHRRVKKTVTKRTVIEQPAR